MQNVMHIVIVTDEFQERLRCGACLADTQQVLGSWIHPLNEQALADDDDSGIELVDNCRWRRVGAARILFAGFPGRIAYLRAIEFCCT